MWGNLDLNQGPTGYEGGGPPYHPTHTSRYAQQDKRFVLKMVIIFAEFCGLNMHVSVPLVYRAYRSVLIVAITVLISFGIASLSAMSPRPCK